jgi:DNA-binding LacI/PurR family transcriptional regulator
VFFAPLEFSAASAEINARVMKLLHGAGLAVVLLDRRPEDSAKQRASDLVGIDNHRAGYLAAEHLLRLGARRLGFVRLEGHASTVKARIRGYQDALADFGGAGQVFTKRPDRPLEWNAETRACDAFVCANDRVAAHWMQTLLAQGVRIPRDVRIVGIDDVNYAAPARAATTCTSRAAKWEAAMRVMLDGWSAPRCRARDVRWIARW